MEYWKNITITLPGHDLKEIADQLIELNILSVSIQDLRDTKESDWFHYYDKSIKMSSETHSISILYDGKILSANIIQDIKNHLKIDKINIINERIIQDQDWLLRSQAQFPGIKISNNLQIIPPWQKIKNKSITNVIINPGSGFGTGSHPTTKLCINWIEENNIDNKSLIDYGSGSGILAIVAKLHGADKVVGAEIDRKAIDNAIQNCKINNIQIPFIDLNKTSIHKKFDILISNILSNTLIQLSTTFKTLAKKKLILSGILDKQVPDVINTYSDWIILKQKKNLEGWNLLEGEIIA
ncbi:MAG: hypothetical protein CMF99_00020 [Candidatus Marinimicrobia bacterium]|nr:hypothetical protein [Candidatus Neomarinimicrobiota bacterium]|tara:strand:+ start:2277 stop:3164 length:888 start_codon:yes stop_codon:yes gene_type:complete